jgi:hypothetical protein
MNIRNFIKYILNNVHDLNAYSLAIRNRNYQKNNLNPFIKFNEKDIEVKGDFIILNLPEDVEIIQRQLE